MISPLHVFWVGWLVGWLFFPMCFPKSKLFSSVPNGLSLGGLDLLLGANVLLSKRKDLVFRGINSTIALCKPVGNIGVVGFTTALPICTSRCNDEARCHLREGHEWAALWLIWSLRLCSCVPSPRGFDLPPSWFLKSCWSEWSFVSQPESKLPKKFTGSGPKIVTWTSRVCSCWEVTTRTKLICGHWRWVWEKGPVCTAQGLRQRCRTGSGFMFISLSLGYRFKYVNYPSCKHRLLQVCGCWWA